MTRQNHSLFKIVLSLAVKKSKRNGVKCKRIAPGKNILQKKSLPDWWRWGHVMHKSL